MKFKNRNLLLFFEQNEDKNNISSNLVRMFMNRYVIEEEKRYEIIGTFNLSKVSHSRTSPDWQNKNFYIYGSYWNDSSWRKKSDQSFKINWNKDKKIIETALKEAKVFTKLHVETHIIIGTSLYIDHFDNSSITFRNNRFQRFNQLTLLNGWKTTFATKDQVRQAYNYRNSYMFMTVPMSSVNDDLENMYSLKLKPMRNSHQHVKTFLYEMLSGDAIPVKEQRSNKFQFLRSKCERLTVTLSEATDIRNLKPVLFRIYVPKLKCFEHTYPPLF